MAHGPHPRDYTQRTPKKMIRLTLKSALSDRANESKVMVVDDWDIAEPKTKQAIERLGALGLRTKGEWEPRVLIVVQPTDEAVWKSFRNLDGRIQLIIPNEMNAYDILVNDWLVFYASLDTVVARLGSGEVTEDAAE